MGGAPLVAIEKAHTNAIDFVLINRFRAGERSFVGLAGAIVAVAFWKVVADKDTQLLWPNAATPNRLNAVT